MSKRWPKGRSVRTRQMLLIVRSMVKISARDVSTSAPKPKAPSLLALREN